MARRRRYTFFIDDEQRTVLTAIKERDGISESEQIRRAIDGWIHQKGVAPHKVARKRPPARKRSERSTR